MNYSTNSQMNIGGAEMSDMTREEAIEKARSAYMECYWEMERVLSNLYDDCDDLEEGDLNEWRIDG